MGLGHLAYVAVLPAGRPWAACLLYYWYYVVVAAVVFVLHYGWHCKHLL